jgi:hypothetical protein
VLRGAEPGAGIRAPSPEGPAISLYGVRKIRLDDLLIDGSSGTAGITTGAGSSFVAFGATVRGGSIWGIWIGHGSNGYLHGCTIVGGPLFGISVSGAAELHNCEIRRNRTGVYAGNGGNITVSSSIVSKNDLGISAFAHGSVRVADSVIESNRNGVDALQNSTVHVRDNSR